MTIPTELEVMAWMQSDDILVRRDAAEILGDWVRWRSGNDEESVRRFHQALLDAALVETDQLNLESQLNSLLQSEWSPVGVRGWDALARLVPRLRGEAASSALENVALSGDWKLADVLEAGLNEEFGFPRNQALQVIAKMRALGRRVATPQGDGAYERK